MFKKFKDKLAEEVKSSPQRIQQFAQAAQAAVTSASSSISDITNNDLFSIGDNETTSKNRSPVNTQQNSFKDVSLNQAGDIQPNIQMDYTMNDDITMDYQRQRRLSNSSFASDISFRLPSYESPSMYHLQSDMEVSASEAEDKGFPGGTVNLDRVTKEQLYSAYRRTQDRCTKYKTQYADLARHYKLLERENAKARNVLVETQDKALRRISELREQCSLEQSAKAHLEKALRIEIEEKNMKIETLNTQLSYLKSNDNTVNSELVTENNADNKTTKNNNEALLINFTADGNEIKPVEDTTSSEVMVLNNKIEKMEQLLNKYKDSLKTTKEKNSQLTTELKIISSELEAKNKENDQLKAATISLTEARKKIQDLNEIIEDLENKNNTYEFSKQKEISILELNLKNAQEEILKLQENVQILSKREEDYAISLAENKLSIHKELESKEKEIKSLKDSFADSQKEIQSLKILSNEFKNNITQLEEERDKLKNEISSLNVEKSEIVQLKADIENLAQKCQTLENSKSKSEEEYKCLQLQVKQETAEKLAMIDRNTYLEDRNSHLLEENTKKSSQINQLDTELEELKRNVTILNQSEESDEVKKYIKEVDMWKLKCNMLESEFQEERVELVKLHSEINKLLANYELVQKQNEELNSRIEKLNSEHIILNEKVSQSDEIKSKVKNLQKDVSHLQELVKVTSKESNLLKTFMNTHLQRLRDKINVLADVSISNIANDTKQADNLKQNNESLLLEIQTIKDQFEVVNSELKHAVIENSNLKLSLNQSESDCILRIKEIESLNVQNQVSLEELNKLKIELGKKYDDIKQCREESAITKKELKNLKEEKEELNKTLALKVNDIEVLKDQVNKTNNLYTEAIQNLNETTKEIKELRNLKTNYEDKCNNAVDLQKRIEELKQENISLKNSSETITNTLKGIESELNEVRKSHTEIEIEKDHLNSIIENLDKRAANLCNQNTQTEKMIDKELLEQEISTLKDTNELLKQENEQQKATISKTDDILVKLNDVMNNYDVLKEEKRQLQSEIEGLQTHLAKVSKENSRLNDSMRELIAGGDHTSDNKSEKSYELQCLKDELGAGQEKIDNLIRENTLLSEENLELKDQINNQRNNKISKMTEVNKFHSTDISIDKFNDLLDTNKSLEKQVTDLELINQSVSGNMQQVQSNNEKLRLSNDKLERRLDEALVSLRHLHSLQENTELEYLKNILYEYLTGTGTHSITLAKVLAAVVKFDDRQTEAVLQKEKERQGILRQLGII